MLLPKLWETRPTPAADCVVCWCGKLDVGTRPPPAAPAFVEVACLDTPAGNEEEAVEDARRELRVATPARSLLTAWTSPDGRPFGGCVCVCVFEAANDEEEEEDEAAPRPATPAVLPPTPPEEEEAAPEAAAAEVEVCLFEEEGKLPDAPTAEAVEVCALFSASVEDCCCCAAGGTRCLRVSFFRRMTSLYTFSR